MKLLLRLLGVVLLAAIVFAIAGLIAPGHDEPPGESLVPQLNGVVEEKALRAAGYRVRHPDGTTAEGTGGPAAQAAVRARAGRLRLRQRPRAPLRVGGSRPGLACSACRLR